MNPVNYVGDYVPSLSYSPYNRFVRQKFGSADAWANATVKRLHERGFNTIGSWSSEEAVESLSIKLSEDEIKHQEEPYKQKPVFGHT